MDITNLFFHEYLSFIELKHHSFTHAQVGVGIGSDATKIFKDYNVSVEAAVELSYLAKQKLGVDSQKWRSLGSLTENFVSKQVYILFYLWKQLFIQCLHSS